MTGTKHKRHLWTGDHDHIFGQDQPSAGERRTLIVVLITAVTMVVELAAGMAYGSMALLADGLHMASHTVALGIATFAYRYARRHAADPRFSFGTGKINALAGFSGAVLLGVFALVMVVESIERFVNPIDIAVNPALLVAVVGLLVNGACVLILGINHSHGDDQEHEHHHHQDHNFRAAYFHVLADALTSILAIAALLAAKYFGQTWLDPMMGIVGAILVGNWSIGLLRESGQVLLDRQVSNGDLDAIRQAMEMEPATQVVDLHVWMIGPGRKAAIVSIQSTDPHPLETYRTRVPVNLGIKHVTIEVSLVTESERE